MDHKCQKAFMLKKPSTFLVIASKALCCHSQQCLHFCFFIVLFVRSHSYKHFLLLKFSWVNQVINLVDGEKQKQKQRIWGREAEFDSTAALGMPCQHPWWWSRRWAIIITIMMMADVDGDVVIKEEASELNGNKSPIDGAGRETWPEITRNKHS